MGWVFLVIAGVLEVGFTTAMKLTGNGKWWPYALFLVFAILSFGFLSQALKTIPIGIAYAVWTGIGAAGTLVVSLYFFGESINRLQVFFIFMLITAIAGLKLSSSQ